MRYLQALLTVLLCISFIIEAQPQQDDTLRLDEQLDSLDDRGFLVSASGVFCLGFFSPGSSINRHQYLGIWYHQIGNQTVVWVANRHNPLPTAGGVLSLATNGTLILTGRNRTLIYWNSTVSRQISSPVARLQDDGNLVVVDEGGGTAANLSRLNSAWQSFDYPTDTLLSGMKLGRNLRKGLEWKATAWKSPDDPAPGPYAIGVDLRGVPQVFLRESGGLPRWRTGPWNGQRFSGIPDMRSYVNMFDFSFVDNSDEVYYQVATSNASHTMATRLVLDSSGDVKRLVWNPEKGSWNVFFLGPKDQCDTMNPCGTFGECNPNDSPICSCVQGFRPKLPHDWALRDGSGGCVRKTPLSCGNGTDGFLVLRGAKLPDTVIATLVNKVIGLDECRAVCLKNCSCTAYAAADIAGPVSGCIVWTGDLSDIRVYTDGGQDLYVKLAAADLDSDNMKRQQRRKIKLAIILVLLLSGVGLLGCGGWMKLRRNKRKNTQDTDIPRVTISKIKHHHVERNKGSDLELPLFELHILVATTNKFSIMNKLGEGGFGPVYKGTLEDGHDVAIKRLSRNSTQGDDELKNEVRLIAKLQHRNLVRLLGCCIQGEERMLIYEYMPNKSLDGILFDHQKASLLNWNIRYQIIIGIAKGVLYLHQDSRFRIIHRDLKASNILLDNDMIPKISDFGLARIFGGDETEANTKRVVGTYGYMSPEYAMDGVFSVKSDVFSFGVLVLEIITGIKNKGVFHSQPQYNLLGQVWSLWKEGNILELIDRSIGSSFSDFELMKCIHIGLLCVQEHPEDRPTMSSIIHMLESEVPLLPEPKNPGFHMLRDSFEMHLSSGQDRNDLSVTILVGR